MSNRHTREWWKERLPLIQAFVEGKLIQLNRMAPDGGMEWKTRDTPDFHCPIDDYRIAPEPKLRPWKPKEVPADCWVRTKGCGKGMWRILVIQPNGIVTAHGSADRVNPLQLASYEFALEAFEHSTDCGKTWHPCGVMEE